MSLFRLYASDYWLVCVRWYCRSSSYDCRVPQTRDKYYLYRRRVLCNEQRRRCADGTTTTRCCTSTRSPRNQVGTVLPAKGDSDVRFCLQKYQDLESIYHLCINPIHRIGLIHKWSIDSRKQKWSVQVKVSLNNCKQSITSRSLWLAWQYM